MKTKVIITIGYGWYGVAIEDSSGYINHLGSGATLEEAFKIICGQISYNDEFTVVYRKG